MKRPPRPGEKIWVLRKWPVQSTFLHEAVVWSHGGLWIYYARRTDSPFKRIVRPSYAAGPRDHRVHRSDEGVTWARDQQGADAWRAAVLLRNSAR